MYMNSNVAFTVNTSPFSSYSLADHKLTKMEAMLKLKHKVNIISKTNREFCKKVGK